MCQLFQRLILSIALFFTTFFAVAAGSTGTFTLGSGDTIKIFVYGEEDLSLEALLGDSGMLNYPFLGELKIAGLTVAQVEKLITKGLLGDYLVEPKVTVSVLEYRQFFINGEVKDPDAFAFQPGLTVGKAISIAGGFTERANKRDISLISDSDRTGKSRKVSLASPVKPGDIITVKQSFF